MMKVYAPRLDDVYSRTFERCSTDVFQITGPCTYQICYVYLYRAGSDGWKPETVRIDGYYTKSITFNYNTFIPRGVWFGFNFCQSFSQPSTSSVQEMRWFAQIHVYFRCLIQYILIIVNQHNVCLYLIHNTGMGIIFESIVYTTYISIVIIVIIYA